MLNSKTTALAHLSNFPKTANATFFTAATITTITALKIVAITDESHLHPTA